MLIRELICSLLCSTCIHEYSYETGFVPSVGKTGFSKWQVYSLMWNKLSSGKTENQWTINEKDNIRLQKKVKQSIKRRKYPSLKGSSRPDEGTEDKERRDLLRV